jgi:hypothetical protein
MDELYILPVSLSIYTGIFYGCYTGTKAVNESTKTNF